ncbi:MAG: GNAT family N-acetyltransferase [Pirellulales bacterium]
MQLAFRRYESDDQPQVEEIWSLSFFGGSPLPDFVPFCADGQSVFVAEDVAEPGRILAAYKLHHLTAWRGSSYVDGADDDRDGVYLTNDGVGLVGVRPEVRQTGVGGKLLRWGLAEMRGRGTHFSSLYAFSEAYYRRLGWESTGTRVQILCPNKRMPRLKVNLPVRQLTADQWPLLEAAYDRFARRYCGMSRRSQVRWDRVLRPKDPNDPVIYALGDPVESYVVLNANRAGWNDQAIVEFVWTSVESYRSALGFLANLGINQRSLVWQEPSDGPFRYTHHDKTVEQHLIPPPQFRIVDVPGAIAALRTNASGEFRFQLSDEQLPENDGPWRVAFSPAGVNVTPCDEADLHFSVQTLTQAVLGEPSLATLVARGYVRSHSESATAAAKALLTEQRVYCLEIF